MKDKIKSFFTSYYDDVKSLSVWFVAVRTMVVLVFGVGIIFFWKLDVLDYDPRLIIFRILPAYLVINIVWFLLGRIKIPRGVILDGQLFIDIVFVTFIIHSSGGPHSDMFFFYVFPVISAVLIAPYAPLAAGLTALFFYGLLIYFEHAGLIIPVHGLHVGFHNDEKIRIGIFVMLISILVYQTIYLMGRIKKREAEVMKAKDDFLFKTAHDLQSPMRAVDSVIEEFSDPQFIVQNPEIKNYVEKIRDLNKRAFGLVHDLLEIAKGAKEEEMYKFGKVDASTLIKKIIGELEKRIIERNISVDIQQQTGPVWVWGDENRLQEIFSNILDNAVKYNNEGGMVKVTFSAEGKRLKITIWNNGKEISKEELPKLFTPYFRGTAEGKIPGTGLGLYIVKKLVEKMNGDISIQSGDGRGTEFIIYLPTAEI